jgi:hypothetical protein
MIVLLTGISLGAAVLGVMYRTRGAQEQITALHAQTQAQIKAWTGAQTLDIYINELRNDAALLGTVLSKLYEDFTTAQANDQSGPTLIINNNGLPGVTVTLMSVTNTEIGTNQIERTFGFEIRAKSGEDQRAESSAILQTEYTFAVTPGSTETTECSPSDPDCDSTITFNRGLKLSGRIDITGETGKQYKVNVNGDLDADGNTITGLEVIRSTGSVSIGSGSSFGNVFSNCDVKITGSVSIKKVAAQRHVCTSGGAGISESILANGTVIINSSGANGDIAARAAGACTGSTLQPCQAVYTGSPLGGTHNGVYFVSGGVNAARIDTIGKINFANSGTIQGATSVEGDLKTGAGVNFGGALRIGGNLIMTGGTAGSVVVVGDVSLPNAGVIADLHVGGKLTSRGTITSALVVGNTLVEGNSIFKLLGGGALNVTAWDPVGTSGIGCDGTNNSQCVSRVKGSITKSSPWMDKVYVRQDTGLIVANPSPVSVEIAPAEIVTMKVGSFDAYTLESQANMAFKYVGGKIKVYLRDMNGMASGEYFLVDGGGDKKDFACPTESFSTSSCVRIGKGYSDSNTLVTYEQNKKTKVWAWNLNGIELAPGIAWFEGNLNVGTGVYYNTFIATESISTSGNHKTYAPNYAGYNGSFDNVNYSPKGICNNSNFTTYPTQLCSKSDNKYSYPALGNYAFMAGSVSKQTTSYVGGNISVGESTVIYGNIKAGNIFTSGGSTTVYGYLTALAQGSDNNLNSMGNSTTIIVNNLPPSFNPNADVGGGSGGGGGGGGGGSGETYGTLLKVGARYR